MRNFFEIDGRWMIVLIAALTLAGACQKDKIKRLADDDLKLKEVTFRIGGFESRSYPLLKMEAQSENGGFSKTHLLNDAGNVPESASEQYLYFLSFNQENTVPEIGIDTSFVEISFSSYRESADYSYVAGRAFAPYSAGKSYSVTGPKEIDIKLPIAGVTALGALSFDISGSNTGPKDFTFAYSLDNDTVFTVLEENNQFLNHTGWNRFAYDLSFLSLNSETEFLWIKLEFKGGERGNAGSYNEQTGTIRFDNLGLLGIYTGVGETGLDIQQGTVYFHLFNKEDSTLATSGKLTFNGGKDSVPEIKVQLREGSYFGSFVVDFSDRELVIPSGITHAADLSMYNPFRNHKAVIYGTILPDLHIDQDTQRELMFERYYSEVRFHFTDELDPESKIGKINITEVQPTYYMPFYNVPDTVSTGQDNAFSVVPNWSSENAGILFHQFLGLLEQPRLVSYQLDVYDKENVLIRTIEVQASIFHNTMLIFSGNILLDSEEPSSGFPIIWNEHWRETKNLTF